MFNTIALDKDGYLRNRQDWTAEIALALAHNEDINLSAAHWEVLFLVRQFYTDYELSPSMRPLVKYIKNNLGQEKGNTLYLQQLFPPNPALMTSKIAGLPRPANCF